MNCVVSSNSAQFKKEIATWMKQERERMKIRKDHCGIVNSKNSLQLGLCVCVTYHFDLKRNLLF